MGIYDIAFKYLYPQQSATLEANRTPSFSSADLSTEPNTFQTMSSETPVSNYTPKGPSAWISGGQTLGDGAKTSYNPPINNAPTTQTQDPNALLQQQNDAYLADLDNQLNSLSGQRSSLEGQVQSQGAQTGSELDLQRTQGLQSLGQEESKVKTNQTKTLRDLAGNVTNAMRAGQIYLGARGAGDSSAANMYSYALTKLGTRERSNVMQNTANLIGEIDARRTNLDNIYNSEKGKLQSWINEQLNSIGQWYYNAVGTIQNQKAQLRAQLSQQLLEQAMSALNSMQQYAINKQTALDQWAMNNSTNLANLRTNMESVSNPNFQLPTAGNIVGTPSVSGLNMVTPTGGGTAYADEEERRFG